MTTAARYRFPVATAEAMADLGRHLGQQGRAGDVFVLGGELGSGKTTLTQGIARGMGIEEHVTSPTFVIARTHPHPGAGPDLVHVDMYRLGSAGEIDDLDLESDLETSIVVVEWGESLADHLSASRLDVRIARSDDEADETRIVDITSHSARWAGILDGLAARVGGS